MRCGRGPSRRSLGWRSRDLRGCAVGECERKTKNQEVRKAAIAGQQEHNLSGEVSPSHYREDTFVESKTVPNPIAGSSGTLQAQPAIAWSRPRLWQNKVFMSLLLEGKQALVLGVANRWSLAFAIAEAFRRQGACLTLTYQGERLRETVESLAQELSASRVLPCDVSDDRELAQLAEKLAESPGRLDAVVHSIAFANREDLGRPFSQTSRAGFALAHDVSVYSLVAVARAVAPLMDAGGSLTTLTYLGSTRVIPNYNVMGVAKAALEATVRYLALELGEKAVRVNAISAGPIRTLAASGISNFSEIFGIMESRSPMHRSVTQEEVGKSALYLLSDMASGVTGEVHFVDTGYNIVGL